jgi:acyl-CoA thioesterase
LVESPGTDTHFFTKALDLDGVAGRYGVEVDETVWEGQAGTVFGALLLAIVVRAAGIESSAARPVSMACQYMRPTVIGVPLEIEVASLRRGRTNELLRVAIGQAGKPTVEALVRTADGDSGPECSPSRRPEFEDPLTWPSLVDVFREHGMEPSGPKEAFEVRHRGPDRAPDRDDDFWFRLIPGVTYDDPYMEAARVVMGLDSQGVAVLSRLDRLWGPAEREPFEWGFSNLDSLIHFHQATGTEWLCSVSRVVTGCDGFVSAQSQTWSADGDLLATAMSQIAFFPLREGWSFLSR